MSAALERAIVAALSGDNPPSTVAQLRSAVGAHDGEVRPIVQKMRYQGKILFDRLELSPSLRDETEGEADEASTGAGAAVDGPLPVAAPVPEPEVSVAIAVRREADEASATRKHRDPRDRRRRVPTSIAEVRQQMALSIVEDLQTRLAEDPRDLIKTIARRHPRAWRRVIELGRALGVTPAEALYRALEAGLAAEEGELTSEREAAE